MDLPKKFLDELAQTHLKYVKNQCVANNIKYTINDINLKEIDTISECLKEENGDKIEYETVKHELQTIAKNMKDLNKNDSKLLVYDLLNKVDNMGSQNYLCYLLESYFQQMHQEIPTLTKQVFEIMVKIIFSYIKFKKSDKADKKRKNTIERIIKATPRMYPI